MTDTTTPSNPLAWLTITLPADVTKILIDNMLTSAVDIAACSDTELRELGIPLGLVKQIKRIVAPAPPTPTLISSLAPAGPGETLTAPGYVPTVAPAVTPLPALPSATTVPTVGGGSTVISLVEPTVGERIKQHLAGLAGNDMESRGELMNLGVQWVVVGPDNLPIVQATLEMRAQLGNKAPEGGFWVDQPVISINNVGMINFHSPSTLQLLQSGMDAQSGVPWGSLGLEGLIKARGIYALGMTGGAAEQVVFDDVRTNGRMTQRVTTRFTGDPMLRVRFEQEVAPRQQPGNPAMTGVARAPAGMRRSPIASLNGNGKILGSSTSGPLQHVLVEAFSTTDAMRKFAEDACVGALPGTAATRAELAFAIAAALGRTGKVESALNYIVGENPSLRNMVDQVRNQIGL